MTDSVYEQLLARLGEAHPQPRLSAMRRVTELLGDPQHSAPVIQVAGTNGKSSVSRMVEALLRAHGLRTGLFVSPHLQSFSERILLDGEPVSEETLSQAWEELHPLLDFVDGELSESGEQPITFFEAMTLLAFAIFADAPVDVMVLEVGMGGEWDATNIANAAVAVFTPIDIDHVAALGGTRAEIARTKAGIIKEASRVVSAAQTPEVLEVLRARAVQLASELQFADTDFSLLTTVGAVGGQQISVRGTRAEYPSLPLALHGAHQAQNAALAIAAVEAFLADEHPLNGEVLADALETVRSPGRFERICTDPLLVVDAAHNPHSAAALVQTLADTFPDRECAFLVGVLADKDAAGILTELGRAAQTFFITAPSSERSLSSESLVLIAQDAVPEALVIERETLPDAVESLRDWVGGAENRIGVVTGSIVLIGEVMTYVHDQHWSEH